MYKDNLVHQKNLNFVLAGGMWKDVDHGTVGVGRLIWDPEGVELGQQSAECIIEVTKKEALDLTDHVQE